MAFANAYEWENLDEVKEFCSQAMLTFVGDFHNNFDYFKKKLGYLHCIKTPDNRFYAIADSALANYKLPYIIVDQAPKSSETFSDFVLLKEQYEWDEETCKHLLPGFSIPNRWQESNSNWGKERSKEDALSQIEQLLSELQKKDAYLPEPTSLYGNNIELSKNEL